MGVKVLLLSGEKPWCTYVNYISGAERHSNTSSGGLMIMYTQVALSDLMHCSISRPGKSVAGPGEGRSMASVLDLASTFTCLFPWHEY